MLVDDTPNGAFTVGMADRLQKRLAAAGIAVSRISIKELADNVEAGYYAPRSRRPRHRGRICSTSARISPRAPRSPRRWPPPAPRPGA